MPRMTLEHLPNRAVLSLTGPDALILLERLVTHNTMDWQSGDARYGALLTPQGKVIADYIALRTDDGVLIDVAKDFAADLLKRLKMFRLRSEVEITLRDDLHVLVSDAPGDDTFVDPRHTELPFRQFSSTQSNAIANDYKAKRIALGIPEQSEDFGTAQVFPAEINMDLLGGVDLKKGCFVGQEVVSRMHRRGNIRKRTVAVHGTALEPGLDVMAPASLGVITSAGPDMALARIRIDRLAKSEGEALSVNDKPVSVEKTDWLQAEMAAFISHD